MRNVGRWCVVICVGCGGFEEGPAEPPRQDPLAHAVSAPVSAPARDTGETEAWGPTIRLEHEHSGEPAMDLAAARAAVDRLEPDAAHADEVLFDYAVLSLRTGEEREGMDAMLRLIREYPTSPFVMHAYAAFADFKFDAAAYDDASVIYEKLLSFTEPDVNVYATYRMAWCRLRTDQPDDALELFVRAFRALDDRSSWTRELQSEVLHDAARTYALVGRPDRAKSFFASLVRKTDTPVSEPLRVLARAYADAGNREARAEICAQVDGGC